MKLFSIIFIVVALLFMGVGAGIAVKQHRRISRSVPVRATVLATRVDRHESRDSKGHRSVSYTPIVEFRYEVEGRAYTSSDVYPLTTSSGSSWAYRVISPFQAGQVVEAYHDSAEPASAFLLRRYSFFPYIFMLFPMIFVAIGLGTMVGSGASARHPPVPVPDANGWFELTPRRSIAAKRRASLFATVAWIAAGMAICGHYFVLAAPHYDTTSFVVTGLYAALGLIPTGLAVRYGLLGRVLADARVFINAESVRTGGELTVGAQQTFHAGRQIESARLGLICEETTRTSSGGKTSISTRTRYEKLDTVKERHGAQPGERVDYSTVLTVPPDEPASASQGYPLYAWKIRLIVAVAGSPDYTGDFPITVLAGDRPTGPEDGVPA